MLPKELEQKIFINLCLSFDSPYAESKSDPESESSFLFVAHTHTHITHKNLNIYRIPIYLTRNALLIWNMQKMFYGNISWYFSSKRKSFIISTQYR